MKQKPQRMHAYSIGVLSWLPIGLDLLAPTMHELDKPHVLISSS